MAIGVLLNLLLFETISKVFIIFEELVVVNSMTCTRVNTVTKDVTLRNLWQLEFS